MSNRPPYAAVCDHHTYVAIAETHQPGSQDSIFRDCPGGGGVSLNRTPLASLRVPGPKKLPCGASERGRKLRSAPSAVRRRTDIARGRVGTPAQHRGVVRGGRCYVVALRWIVR